MNTTPIQEVDVRLLPPRQRHPIIFGLLGDLAPGDALHVASDHDPQPLHMQIDSRYPDLFRWSYLEAGPDVWRVEIRRQAGGGCGCCCGH
ncbi:DUF2249 domain-containing protein [Rhizobium lemnae]|uniref:DUF2249 domain-containing protein n=1 Tax=Rhizobium lemnae TaxID=1214924 RepID=A0ABV8EBQ8_9HYPH|nr:DUF2249 domain-containing protein [Rhizobium lemnae]MCJ8507360.1 DUF2249 domain-containing protein [Rhizobium lemnae]